MNTFSVGRRFAGWTFMVLAVTLALAFVAAGLLGYAAASIEEGPLERAQEVVLALSIFLFVGAAIYQRGAGRMASFGMVLLCIVFFLRELELPVSGPVTAYLHTDMVRLHETIALLALGLPYLALRWRLIPQFWAYAVSLRGWPFVLSAALIGLGAAAEAMVPYFPVWSMGVFFEETFETMAYVVLACLAVHVMVAAFQQYQAQAAGTMPQPVTRLR